MLSFDILTVSLSLSLSSTQIHFTVAIDFTASNGKNFQCWLFPVLSLFSMLLANVSESDFTLIYDPSLSL